MADLKPQWIQDVGARLMRNGRRVFVNGRATRLDAEGKPLEKAWKWRPLEPGEGGDPSTAKVYSAMRQGRLAENQSVRGPKANPHMVGEGYGQRRAVGAAARAHGAPRGPLPSVGQLYTNLVKRPLARADLAAGEHLYQKSPKLLKPLWQMTETHPVGEVQIPGPIPTKTKLEAEVRVHRLTAPVDRVKQVLPYIGGIALMDKVAPTPKTPPLTAPSAPPGSPRTAATDRSVQALREVLGMTRVAEAAAPDPAHERPNSMEDPSRDWGSPNGMTDGEKEQVAEYMHSAYGYPVTDVRKVAEMFQNVARLVKVAQTATRQIREQNERIAALTTRAELAELALQARERAARAHHLAEDMQARGMIREASFDSKVDELMELDDGAFGILAETVENAPDSGQAEHLASLLPGGLSTGSAGEEAPTLRDAIRESVRTTRRE